MVLLSKTHGHEPWVDNVLELEAFFHIDEVLLWSCIFVFKAQRMSQFRSIASDHPMLTINPSFVSAIECSGKNSGLQPQCLAIGESVHSFGPINSPF